MSIATLLQIFGPNLDIVYPDANRTVESAGYKNIIYWNDTRLIPDAPSMPLQNEAGNESAWQLQKPTPQNPSSLESNSTSIYAAGICALALAAVALPVLKFRKNKK